MRDEYSKKIKLSWSRKLVRKWFNIKGKIEEFQSDESVCGGSYEWRRSISDWEHCTMKKSKTEKSTRGMEHPARGSVDLDRPQIINVQNYRVFVSTWNVGGESPPSNLNLNEWPHSSTPADIYVLGFQEIVPLNAGNILGVEDNGPAKKWMAFIGKTLNSGPGTSGGKAIIHLVIGLVTIPADGGQVISPDAACQMMIMDLQIRNYFVFTCHKWRVRSYGR